MALPCILNSFCVNLFAVPAKFISEPKFSVIAYKTWDTVLHCDIFGYPSPVITWTRPGRQLPFNRHIINGSQLTIHNATRNDAGAYVCQGTNSLANVMRVIWVIVKVVGEYKNVKNLHIDD